MPLPPRGRVRQCFEQPGGAALNSREAANRTYTVRLSDPVEDPDLQRLLRFLQDKAKALRTKARSEGSP